MVDPATFAPPPPRSRLAPLVILVTIAFAIGLAAMWFAVRNNDGWFRRQATPAQSAPSAQPTPTAAAQSALPAAPGPASATSQVANRETVLAAQLAALEARAATVTADASTAGQQAGRAENILVAFAARRAIDRGVALGYLEEQLRQRFGATQPRATAIVIEASRDPVTIEALRQALDANAPLMMSAGGSWLAGLERELRSLVVLHDATAPSPLPADRLARARRMLDAGQVEPAVAEIARLPGASQAANWVAAARRYIAARRALDTLEAAAITTPPPVVPAAPATPPVAVAPETAAPIG